MKESGNKFRYSKCEKSKVLGVQFGLMSDQEIRNWTVDELKKRDSSEIYEENGLCDLRLGINSPFEKCKTCGETEECPGHFGRIELAKPIYHIGYIEFIVKILKCICCKCSKLKYPVESKYKEQNKKYHQLVNQTDKLKKIDRRKNIEIQHIYAKRLDLLAKILEKVTTCTADEAANKDACGEEQYKKIELKAGLLIQVTDKHDKVTDLTAEQCYDILLKIPKEHAEILGFTSQTKPHDLIIKSLLVPPPQIRPSIEFVSNQSRSQDDLTIGYNNVLKLNLALQQPSTIDIKKQTLVSELQLYVARMFDNEKDEMQTLKINKGKKKLKSIKERLKGKEGRFRQNLMGKRVDFSSRSVISPDSNIALDELGVPKQIADQLTLPEEVNDKNISKIMELVDLGKIKCVIKPNQEKQIYEYFDVEKQNKDDLKKQIAQGVVVERNICNGDYVLFNRQPTLHKMSMMAHRVRILPYSTFRLNLSVCTPYNADFDGDEMNMHVPQSYETRAELMNICHVPKQITAPKQNKPVMGIVQDGLIGISLFTLRDTFLTKEQFMQLVTQIDIDKWEGEIPMPAILKPQPLWTGKQAISLIIPQKISMRNGKTLFDEKDSDVLISQGELLCGVMSKQQVGDGAGGLVHNIWLSIGAQATCDFISQLQKIVNSWLMMNGFTISCSDIVPDENTNKKVSELLIKIDTKFDEILKLFQDEKQIQERNWHKAGQSIFDSFEVNINAELNSLGKQLQDAVKDYLKLRSNNFYKMVWASSKGSYFNMQQVMGVVGQQNIEGARIALGFNRRTLPHFTKDDQGLSARGFVKSNFYSGLKPYEFFFHTMGGREGLSDTAVKTSRTGYIQRKLIKAVEDVTVQYDGTVRDSNGGIIQFSYGEDGLAAEYIEQQTYLQEFMEKGDEEMEIEFHCGKLTDNEKKKLDKDILQQMPQQDQYQESNQLVQEFNDLKKARDDLRKLFMKAYQIDKIYLPVNIQRMIESIKNQQYQNRDVSQEQIKLNPFTVVQSVNNAINELDQELKKRNQENTTDLFKIHFRVALASKKLLFVHQFDESMLKTLIEQVKTQFHKALVHPGEAVGAIAAQSIGEPTTQMTLNTFHSAGVSERNVTLGVPRLQELMDGSKKIKTPQMTIYLKDHQNLIDLVFFEKEKAKVDSKKPIDEKKNNGQIEVDTQRQEFINRIKEEIQYTKIKDYILQTLIYYCSTNETVKRILKKNDLQGEEEDEMFNEDEESQIKNKYVLFIIFNEKKIVVKEIWEKIKAKLIGELKLKEDNLEADLQNPSINQSIRYYGMIYYRTPDTPDEYLRIYNIEYRIREEFVLSGIPKIKKVYKMEDDDRKNVYRTCSGGEILPKKCSGGYYKEPYLSADGSDLKEVLQHPDVDTRRTFTNDVQETTRVLGIEAARVALFNEIYLCFNKYSIYINYRHICMLIDWMCNQGKIIPVNRNGINRVPNSSALKRSSFEETCQMLFQAAAYSEFDNLRGVTENIIFGQTSRFGTNAFDLLINYDSVREIKELQGKDNITEDETNLEYLQDQGRSQVMNTPYIPDSVRYNNQTEYKVGSTPFHLSGQFSQYQPSTYQSEASPIYGTISYSQMVQQKSTYDPTPQSPLVKNSDSSSPNNYPSVSQHTPQSPHYSPMALHQDQITERSSESHNSSPNMSPKYTNPQSSSMRSSMSPTYGSQIISGQGSGSPQNMSEYQKLNSPSYHIQNKSQQQGYSSYAQGSSHSNENQPPKVMQVEDDDEQNQSESDNNDEG